MRELSVFSACILFSLLSANLCEAEIQFTTVVDPTPSETDFVDTITGILNACSDDNVTVIIINQSSHPNGTLIEFSIDTNASLYLVAANLRDGILNGGPFGFDFFQIPAPVHLPIDSICSSEVVPVIDIQNSFRAEEFSVEVTCKISFIVITLDACDIAKVGINPLNLVLGPIDQGPIDDACKPILVETENGSLNIVFLHTFTQSCGVKAENTTEDGIITFTLDVLSNEVNPESTIIQRFRSFCITVKCHYNDSDYVNFGPLEPALRKVTFDPVANSGDFTFDVSLCLNEDCSQPVEPGSVVDVPDFVYVVADLSVGESENIVVEAESCYATPTSNPEDPVRYDFIESCVVPDDNGNTIIVVNGGKQFFEFAFASFVWTGNDEDKIFVHCHVFLCYNTTGNCAVSGCTADGVSKRSVSSHSEQFITFPHFTTIASCDETNKCDHYCKMKQGIPTCFCHPGFVLNEDGVSCSRQMKREAVLQSDVPVVMLIEQRNERYYLVALGTLIGFLIFLVLVIVSRVNGKNSKPNSKAIFPMNDKNIL